MRVDGPHIVMAEIPRKITLAYQVYGCDVHCPSCHSKYLWDENAETSYELTKEKMLEDVFKYGSTVDCILFLGGEWKKELTDFLDLSKELGKETALYTGRDISEIPESIKTRLDYLKYGPYDDEYGPLNKTTTNQHIIDMKTGEDITNLFWKH